MVEFDNSQFAHPILQLAVALSEVSCVADLGSAAETIVV